MKLEQLRALYRQPLFDLISQSRQIHLGHWRGEEVQRCSLLSIKTGGCSEDCAYCAQSAHYSTGVEREDLLSIEQIVDVATRARAQGATRFCMGAAWRGVRDGTEKFERVLEIVREVGALGMEVCVTLGEIGPVEAGKLKAAGVTAYNHNIDTSPDFYPEIVSTHTFQDRLDTIAAVQASGMSVCSGGIIGMGESEDDRLRMIEILSELDPQPQSVPINCLMPQRGNRAAGSASAARRWTHPNFTRRPGALFFRRRKFHLLRRQTAHRQKSRGRCRPCIAERVGIEHRSRFSHNVHNGHGRP